MKTFEVVLREGEEHFTTSLVKNPAIEENLIYFNSQKPVFFANDEKRVIYAVAMRPNKLIYRSEVEGEPANVFYTEETVEKFQQKYAKHLGQKLTNINHSADYINDVYPIENWIVKNPQNDKSNEIGLATEKGDLVMAFKVENDDVWQQCKEGNIDGLSIEAYFDNIEVKNKNQLKMRKMSIWDSFKKAIKQFAEDNAGTAIEVDGTKWNVTALAVDGVVTDEDGAPLEDGSFEFESKIYKTNALGVITEVAEVETMEEEEEKDKEVMEEEDKEKEEMEGEDTAKVIEDLKAENDALRKEIQDLKAEKVEAETKLETMKKQTPKATAIPSTPTKMAINKPYEQMSNLEKYKYNRGKL